MSFVTTLADILGTLVIAGFLIWTGAKIYQGPRLSHALVGCFLVTASVYWFVVVFYKLLDKLVTL